MHGSEHSIYDQLALSQLIFVQVKLASIIPYVKMSSLGNIYFCTLLHIYIQYSTEELRIFKCSRYEHV